MTPSGGTTTRMRAIGAPELDLSRKTNLVSRTWSRGRGLWLQRLAKRSVAWALRDGLIACSLLTLGLLFLDPARFDGSAGFQSLAIALVLATLGSAVMVRRARAGLRSLAAPTRPISRAELELALGASLLVWGVIAQTGAGESPLRPLLFLLVAMYLPWHGARAGVALVGLILGGELLLAAGSGRLQADPIGLGAEGLFIVVFALVYDLSLSVMVRRARTAARAGLDRFLDELERRAREYRLIVSHGDAGEVDATDDREKWMMGSVAQLEGAVHGALEIASNALSAHTAAVLLLSPEGDHLRLAEQLSSALDLEGKAMLAGEGLPGVVLHRGAPVRLCGEFRGAVYDGSKLRPKAFLGVPLLEEWPGRKAPIARGVLLVDRLEAKAFSDDDEQLLTTLAREILRSMVAERVMGSIRKEKDETARFFRALERLNLLSKPAEICEQVAELAREVAPLDFVAVTRSRSEGERVQHQIVEAVGDGSQTLRGKRFKDNAGLVSNVVRLGSPLPGRAFHEMGRTVIFDDALALEGLSSLKVLPMTVGEEVVGTLVCGARARGELREEATRMLGVLAMQAAGSIARARLFERTEELATRDGMTHLFNHRRFQESFEAELVAARRYNRSVALLITDVDHFKSVNDTYGHPIGDQVLKGVAALLQAQARDTDICARYGGEEFAVVLPETDAEGARIIAERIRSALEAKVFQSELGSLKVTMSIGVAAYPGHGEERAKLIDLCDKALYTAKESGRNLVVVAPERRPKSGTAEPLRR